MITNSLEVAATATAASGEGAAITVRGVRKSYGSTRALDGVDLTVRRGEVLALLGPNGAGKTSLVEILEGHRTADAGELSVLGFDPARHERAFRERIGIVLQEEGLEENLTVREMIDLYGAAYPRPRRADEIIELVGLQEQRDVRAGTLSGGQRRRLDLAVGICGDPELIFLDEPTTGFDPAARRAAWDTIRSLRDLGKTILLTTHYIEEAHRLADHVAVLSQGEIVASGTPAELIGAGSGTEIHYRRNGSEVVVRTEDPTRTLHELTGEALAAGETLEGLEVRRPTLEEIYLSLTGEGLE
jgi:ABC-2 type transport system ATP-binding protein